MVGLGFSYDSSLKGFLSKLDRLISYVDVADLSALNDVNGIDWVFHFIKEDPFHSFESRLLNLLEPEQIKIAVADHNIQERICRQPPKLVSFHCGFSGKWVKRDFKSGNFIAASPPLTKMGTLRLINRSLNFIRKSYLVSELGLPVALENLDYQPGGAFEYICEPDFIRKIFEKNPDFYFLLDIAHAEVSALALLGGESQDRLAVTKEYLSLLPLERVMEVHINAPHIIGRGLRDAHLPIAATEMILIKEILAMNLPNLRLLNLECPTKIEEQLRVLHYLALSTRWPRI